MLLNESQYALCCSEIFLFIIHEKMKTFTAGRGLMIGARRMVFLAGLTSCVLVVHLVLKAGRVHLFHFPFLVEIMTVFKKNNIRINICDGLHHHYQSATCKLRRRLENFMAGDFICQSDCSN